MVAAKSIGPECDLVIRNSTYYFEQSTHKKTSLKLEQSHEPFRGIIARSKFRSTLLSFYVICEGRFLREPGIADRQGKGRGCYSYGSINPGSGGLRVVSGSRTKRSCETGMDDFEKDGQDKNCLVIAIKITIF